MQYNEKTYKSTNTEAKAIIRSADVKLYSGMMYNTSAGTVYFQLWDGDPSAGGALIITQEVPTKTLAWYDFGERGYPSSAAGMTLACSSTELTYTGSASGRFVAVFA